MPLKAATCKDNRAVIETEIRIPRNSVVKYNPVVQRNVRSQASINNQKSEQNQHFQKIGWKYQPEKIFYFVFDFQSFQISAKISNYELHDNIEQPATPRYFSGSFWENSGKIS